MGLESTSGFFPANDLEIGFHGITNGQFGNLEFAQSAVYPTLTLSYVDDEYLTTTFAFREWMSEIVSKNGLKVQPINSAGKNIIINKLNSMRHVIDQYTFFAYPTGNITYHGDSDGSIPIYSVQFTVIGSDLHEGWD